MNEAEELTWGEFLIVVLVVLPLMVLRLMLITLFVIHDGAAWLTLLTTRDWVVAVWSDEPSELGDLPERIFVVVWIFVIPTVLIYLWRYVATLFIYLLPTDFALKTWLIHASLASVLACYFWRYFAQPLRQRHWPLFMAAQQQLTFALQCEYVMQRLKIGLKLADWWDSLTE